MVSLLPVGWRLVLVHRKMARVQRRRQPPYAAPFPGRIPPLKQDQQWGTNVVSNLPAQLQAQRQKLLLALHEDLFVLFPLQPLAQVDMTQE